MTGDHDADQGLDPGPDPATDTGSGSGDPTQFGLPAQADVRLAADIQARCRAALEATGDVRIDCEGVERVDASVLQCIGALGNGLRQGDRHLELINQSGAFTRAVELLGFAPLLDPGTSPEA